MRRPPVALVRSAVTLTGALSLLAATGGCTGVKPRADFPAVAADVRARTGYAVHWHDGTANDQAADARVAALLARPLDADAAVQVALLNDRRLQATYERLGVAQADLVAAGLLKNPVFGGAYEFGGGGRGDRIGLSLTLDFVDLLFVTARKQSAAAEVESAEAGVTGAVLDTVGEVKAAFYVAQAARQTAELRRQIAAAAAASADLAKRLRDAGNTTPLALAAEQATHVDAELALARAEGEVVATRERLTGLLGLWGGPAAAWSIDGRLPEPTGDEVDPAGLERRAVAASVDLRESRAAVTARLATIGVARPLGVLSDLEAGVAVEREGGVWYTGPSVTLPVPLFSQGQPATVQAAAAARAAEMTYYARAVEVRSAVRSAHARVVALRRQVDLARRTLLPLRQTVLDQTQLQYNAMQVGGFELLTAKRDQIESAATYLLLLRDYWIARSQLDLILAGRMPPRTDSTGDPSADAGSEVLR